MTVRYVLRNKYATPEVTTLLDKMESVNGISDATLFKDWIKEQKVRTTEK